MDEINFALFAFRVVIGLVIAMHGYGHVFTGGRIEGTGRWFDSMGMKPGKLNAWLATATEFGAGALLVLGFLTPFGGAALVGLMVVAMVTVHFRNGFFIYKEGWEYTFVLAVCGVIIGMLGPGEWSVDHGLDLVDDLDGWTGLIIAAGLGVVGAIAQLAVFYRPPKEEAA